VEGSASVKPTVLNLDQVVAEAGRIAGCAKRLDAQVEALTAAVTTENPWGAGEDETVTLFSEAYRAVSNYAFDVYRSHVDQLQYAAEGLSDGMELWAQNDQEGADRIRAVGVEPLRWG
jgi:hypothetical protein